MSEYRPETRRPKRVKAPAPDGWQQVADAVREVRDQIRESFGPQREVRLVTSGPQALLNSLEPEKAGQLLATTLTEQEKHQTLKRRIRDDVLTVCGFEDGAEVTADGSADNDLAHERADAVMAFLDLARRHSLPNKLLPRGDHPGDWLSPGTEVTVLGQHPAVVVPARDMVTVKLEGCDVTTEFPRMSVTKRGESWTPRKPTIT